MMVVGIEPNSRTIICWAEGPEAIISPGIYGTYYDTGETLQEFGPDNLAAEEIDRLWPLFTEEEKALIGERGPKIIENLGKFPPL